MNLRTFSRTTSGRLLGVLALILLIKVIFLFLDATPSFFYGDSESYLAVATMRWIPPDRSFLYGLLIRRVAFHLHSLQALIYFQAACSCVASWLVCYALLVELRARFVIAAVCGCLCAIEPLQLMMERYVMTEAASNFLFALQFVLVLGYLRRGRLWLLLLAQAVGVLLIGIRISFLPEVLVTSVLVPLISPSAIALFRSFFGAQPHRGFRVQRKELRTVATHLLLALVVSQGCFTLYRNWYGRLMHREPALLYENGAFLVADLAPLVKPSDFPSISRGLAIFKRVTLDPKNIDNRLAQHFADGGLWNAIKTEYPVPRQANDVAAEAATRALFRDPIGAVRLAAETYALYFNSQRMRSELSIDEGVGGQLGAPAVSWLKTFYGVTRPQSYRVTLTKSWHACAVPWYWMILLILPISPVLLWLLPKRNLLAGVYGAVVAELFLVGVTLTVDHPTPRYLTSAAWLVLLLVGMAADASINRAVERDRVTPKQIPQTAPVQARYTSVH